MVLEEEFDCRFSRVIIRRNAIEQECGEISSSHALAPLEIMR